MITSKLDCGCIVTARGTWPCEAHLEPQVMCDGNGECFALADSKAALLADLKSLRDEVTERLQRERLMEKGGGSNYYAGRADVTLFMHGELDALIRRHDPEGDR